MSEKKKSIAKSASLVTLMMLGFKIIGFIKQAVIAYVYGATAETDAYFIAWGFISGVSEAIVKALLVSLVAIYTTLRINKGKKEASKLINGLLEILFPIFALIVVAIILLAPGFSKLLAPTFREDDSSRLTLYIRILSPVLLFGCFELVFGAVSDSHKSFFVPRLQSLIYSLAIIVSCFLLSSMFGVNALVIAQYFSSALFIVLLVVSTKKYHDFFGVKFNEIPELKNILFTAIPLFIGNSALQINQIVDKSITSGLGEGAASALSYCHTLEQFVTNIMIVNIGNVMFANFAEFVAKKEYEKINSTLSKAINFLISLLAGISVITIICSKDIVSIVYFRGSFSQEAVILTSTALIGYAVSFVAVAVRDLSVKSLYAFKDTKSPMMASIISIIINIILSILLSRYIGILGVSLATSVSAVVGMIINAKFFKHHLSEYDYKKHFVTFLKCIPGMMLLAAFCYGVQILLGSGSLLKFAVSAVVGLPLYFAVLYVFKVEGVNEGMLIISNKLRRK